MSSQPSNMANFAWDGYNLTQSGSWCVKPGSIYTNQRANYHYFNNKCGDPYTYYNFWYRRFPGQTKYLNCYNLPYHDPLLKNKWGYVNGSPKCRPDPNLHFNVVDNGFKSYETNTTAPNVPHKVRTPRPTGA